MKAVVCEAFGGPEVLALRELPDPPPPGPGEVQVRIAARRFDGRIFTNAGSLGRNRPGNRAVETRDDFLPIGTRNFEERFERF